MITIIGAGNAGKALGRALLSIGKHVCFGVSSISKYKDAVSNMGERASLSTVQEAIAASSGIVILAVPYPAALEIAATIPDWNNKILVDISTPWNADLSGLAVGLTTSAAEQIAKAAHNARVVKAFNNMGAESIADPTIVDGKVFMPVCSDDEEAKQELIQLGAAIGFEAVDAGRLVNARGTEPLVLLWLQLSFYLPIGRTFEFGLMKKTIVQDKTEQPLVIEQ